LVASKTKEEDTRAVSSEGVIKTIRSGMMLRKTDAASVCIALLLKRNGKTGVNYPRKNYLGACWPLCSPSTHAAHSLFPEFRLLQHALASPSLGCPVDSHTGACLRFTCTRRLARTFSRTVQSIVTFACTVLTNSRNVPPVARPPVPARRYRS